MKVASSTKATNLVQAQKAKGASAKKPPSAGSASVEASASTDSLTSLTSLHVGDTEPVFDVERVEKIKLAIAEGRFTINAEAIAERLITSATELVRSRNPPNSK